MEEQGGAYLFLKTPGADDDALFIRCTDHPSTRLRGKYSFSRMLHSNSGLQSERLALVSPLLC